MFFNLLSSQQNYASSFLSPVLFLDARRYGTGVGHVFWYTVEGKDYDLGELRGIQDWYIRYQLNSVPGVADIVSVGGFVKQYQIDLDPRKACRTGYSFQRGKSKRAKYSIATSAEKSLNPAVQMYVRGTWIRSFDS